MSLNKMTCGSNICIIFGSPINWIVEYGSYSGSVSTSLPTSSAYNAFYAGKININARSFNNLILQKKATLTPTYTI